MGTGGVDVQMTVDAEDPAAAIGKALATLRAAIHGEDSVIIHAMCLRQKFYRFIRRE
jgi:hypothetical protein